MKIQPRFKIQYPMKNRYKFTVKLLICNIFFTQIEKNVLI
jgi:hypothetical protein